jgi:hypothetical protein
MKGINMAGLKEAPREAVLDVMGVSTGTFINYMIHSHSCECVKKELIQQLKLSQVCEKIVSLWIANDFPTMLKKFFDRKRKQRRGKNATRTASENEKKARDVFGEFLAEANRHDADPFTQEWVVELNELAEKYLTVFSAFLQKAARSIKAVSQPATLDKIHGVPYVPRTHLLMLNTKEVTWAEVSERLSENAEDKQRRAKNAWTIEPAELIDIMNMVRGSIAGVLLDTRHHDSEDKRVSIRAICAQLPVLAIVKDDMYVMYDIHALSDTDWLDILNADDTALHEETHRTLQSDSQSRRRKGPRSISDDDGDKDEEEDDDGNVEPESNGENAGITNDSNNGRVCDNGALEQKISKHRGAIPLVRRFPTLIPTVCDFVIENGVSAQGRRRDTGLNVGVSLQDIRGYVLRTIPGLSNFGISTSTVAHLFNPPNKGYRNGKFYKGYIDARTPSKDDTMRQANPSQHTCAAQVKCVMEMGADYKEECHSAGLDDKAKINIGQFCVSKFVKPRNRYPTGKGPKKPDHGFVIASTWSLTIFGLMEILAHPDDHAQGEEQTNESPNKGMEYEPGEEQNPMQILAEGHRTKTVSVQARRRRADILHGIMRHGEETEPLDPEHSEVVFVPEATPDTPATKKTVDVVCLPVPQYPPSRSANTKPSKRVIDRKDDTTRSANTKPSKRVIDRKDDTTLSEQDQSGDDPRSEESNSNNITGDARATEDDVYSGAAFTESNDREPVHISAGTSQEIEQDDESNIEITRRRQKKKKGVICSDSEEEINENEEEQEAASHPHSQDRSHSETSEKYVDDSVERGEDGTQEDPSKDASDTHPRAPRRAHTPGANDPNLVLNMDRYQRPHIPVPSTGIGHVRIRATMFDPSTPYTHYCDIMAFLNQHANKKPNLVLSVDGGTDFTCRYLTPIYFYARAFIDGELDSLTVVQNYAGYSAFNYQIERLWAYLSQCLVGAQLPGTLPEHKGLTPAEFHETPKCNSACATNRATLKAQKEAAFKATYQRPVETATDQKKAKSWLNKKMKEYLKKPTPCVSDCAENRQAALEQIRKDEKKVFKTASKELKRHWDGKKYDSFEIKCEVISDDVPEEVVKELDELKRYFACMDHLKTKSGREFFDIHEFWLLILRHLAKKQTHMISLQAHCGVKTCPLPQCHREGSRMLQDMKRYGMPFNATPHPDRKTNYLTYLEHKAREGRDQAEPDAHVQLQRRPKPPYTPKVCPYKLVDGMNCAGSYVFASKREETRHKKMYHPQGLAKLQRFEAWKKKYLEGQTVATENQKKRQRTRKIVRCKFVENPSFYCNEPFANWALLEKHHKTTGHYNQGNQSSRQPGTCESTEKETERKKSVRKKRRDLAAKKGLTNLTVAVDAMGIVSTEGQCLLKAPLAVDAAQTEAEEREEEVQWGADLEQCKPDVFAAVMTEYDTGGKGIELYRVKEVNMGNSGRESYTGVRWVPDSVGNDDPRCLYDEWRSTRKKESCLCWGVLVYFTKLTVKNKIPAVVVRRISEMQPSLFVSSSTGQKAMKEKSASAQPQQTNHPDTPAIRISPQHLQAGDKTVEKQTQPDEEKATTRSNAIESPHEVGCVEKSFALCQETFEDFSKGVDLYRIVKARSNRTENGFVGKHYVPATPGLSTTDPRCVAAKWHSLGKQEEIPFWKVFVYFDNLNKDGTIPKKAQNAVLSESSSLFAPAPVKVLEIVKTGTSPDTGVLRYLVRMENEQLAWLESNTTASGFESILSEWKTNNQGKSSGVATGRPWVTIPPYSLLKSDSEVIQAGGPLNHVILDAAMTLLAKQTGMFDMLSCLCPVEGYNQIPRSKSHFQIHSCGRVNPHFVSSFFHEGVVWYSDNQQPDIIPPSVLVQMADLYSTGKEDQVFRRLRLHRQTAKDTCGILAFANVVEVALCPDNSGPSKLAGLKFDESRASEWLVLCMTVKHFNVCPKIEPHEKRVEEAYYEFTATRDFLIRVGAGCTRSLRQVQERKGDYVGRGALYNSGDDACGDKPGTSIGQEAHRRILTGCVVRLHLDDNGQRTVEDLWVVTSVNGDEQSVLLSPLDESAQLLDRRVGARSKLTVVGPPCLRCVEVLSLSAFDLIQSNKILVVYPVRKGLLSNTALQSRKANEYTILEATACGSRFDVECMLRVMAKKKVQLQVKVAHLFTIRSMEGYFALRSDITNLWELYDTVLAVLLDNYEVKVGVSLASIRHQHVAAYPVGMLSEQMHLPPFRRYSEFKVERKPRDTRKSGSLKLNGEITIPDMGAHGVFRDSHTADIANWVMTIASSAQMNCQRPKTSAVLVQFRKLVPDDSCEFCYVVAGKIVRTFTGQSLSAEVSDILKKSCASFVEKVEEYLQARKEGQELGSWMQLKDRTWGVYRVRMYMEDNVVMVADVRGVDAPYDRQLQGITDAVSVGGLMGFGGQKLVLAATHTTKTHTDDVVLYRPRNTSCQDSCVEFQQEMFLLGNLKFTQTVVRLTHSDEQNLWAMTRRMTGPISRRLKEVDKKSRLLVAVDLLVQCAEALTEVHGLRIIHRDVKPANFLYEMVNTTSDIEICQVKIADFGCAVQLHPGVDVTTGNTGTRSYKAPEVSLSEQYSQKADVYSFGIMIWELVKGQRRSSQLREAFAQVKKDYTCLEEYALNVCTPPCTGEFGTEIDSLIRQCTEKIQSHRPDMRSVTATLKELRRDNKIQQKPNTPPNRTLLNKPKVRFESALSN